VTEMALRMLATSLCVVGAYAWGLSTPAGDNDKITDLPGLTGESLTMFSGYLSSSDLKEKQIFYWLIEAADSPESAPLLWWSNGGPGCSGLLGLMSEHGPFRPTADSDLELNPYSWHFKANVLYVEQPAGVGFSYSDDPKDLKTGDAQAAIDNRLAIRAFLTKHPRFAKHPLFISSESYGGHYIPTLADEIVRDVVQPPLNFRGFLVGNPYVDPVENAIGLYGTWHGKQLVPSPLFWEWQAKCSNQSLAARAADKSLRMNCDAIETQLEAHVGPLNPYALDWPVCLKTGELHRRTFMARMRALKEGRDVLAAANPPQYEPCEDNYVHKYLNRDDVRTAIHARPHTKWQECSDKVEYDPHSLEVSTEPLYEKLIALNALTILIFSGDDDSVCGTMGTQTWLWKAFDPPKSLDHYWQHWRDADGQVGGYTTQFDGFNFTTVHSAGHEVPEYEPARALLMLDTFFAAAKANKPFFPETSDDAHLLKDESRTQPSVAGF